MDPDNLEFYNLLNQLANENNASNSMNIQYLNRVHKRNLHKKRRAKKRINPMIEYGPLEFKKRFRFSKTQVKYIYDLVDGRSTLEPMVRNLLKTNSGSTSYKVPF